MLTLVKNRWVCHIVELLLPIFERCFDSLQAMIAILGVLERILRMHPVKIVVYSEYKAIFDESENKERNRTYLDAFDLLIGGFRIVDGIQKLGNWAGVDSFWETVCELQKNEPLKKNDFFLGTKRFFSRKKTFFSRKKLIFSRKKCKLFTTANESTAQITKANFIFANYLFSVFK